jgi:hypothetical protein
MGAVFLITLGAGLVGIILSTVLFGFSRSLWALVLRY